MGARLTYKGPAGRHRPTGQESLLLTPLPPALVMLITTVTAPGTTIMIAAIEGRRVGRICRRGGGISPTAPTWPTPASAPRGSDINIDIIIATPKALQVSLHIRKTQMLSPHPLINRLSNNPKPLRMSTAPCGFHTTRDEEEAVDHLVQEGSDEQAPVVARVP